MIKMKSIDYEIISELIKNPRLSDRQLGKILKTSQPTITRRRRDIEKEELLDYTAIPNLKKLGYEILAITLGNRAPYSEKVQGQKAKDFIETHTNIIFGSTGTGIGSDRVLMSVHKDYNDYSRFYRELREEWGGIMDIQGSFIISLSVDARPRDLTYKHLAEQIKQNASTEKKTRTRKTIKKET